MPKKNKTKNVYERLAPTIYNTMNNLLSKIVLHYICFNSCNVLFGGGEFFGDVAIFSYASTVIAGFATRVFKKTGCFPIRLYF